ncbi:hypothetical protein [uncultured Methanobrevibacter sp.]|nr:hypothetical protein [uncultured Methanobrevibacter sp.]
MSMLMSVGGILVVIALAMTVLRNPDQKNKTFIYVLIALLVIFIVLNILW